MMFKEFLANNDLSPAERELLLASIDVVEPDVPYQSGLTISFVAQAGIFYLCDRFGFLCSIMTIDSLLTLLAIGRNQSIRKYLALDTPGQLEFQVIRPPIEERDPAPVALSPAQIRARQLRDSMEARRFGTPISGDTSDVVPLVDASASDTGFNPAVAMNELGLDGSKE